MKISVCILAISFFLLPATQVTASANDALSEQEREQLSRIATAHLDAAKVMLEVWSRNRQRNALDEESLLMISRYVLVALTMADIAQLDIRELKIHHVETLCVAGLPETQGLYKHVGDGSLKREAVAYLERTREDVLSRVKDRQQVYGGSGCFAVPRMEKE